MAEKEKSKGHSTTVGYYVEVRAKSDLPELIRMGHTHVTKEWRQVTWARSPVPDGQPGVFVRGISLDPLAAQHGIMTYEHAHALMAGAVAALPMSCMFVEFRLRKVEMVSEWRITDQGVGRTVNFFEDERAEEFAAPTTGETDG